MTRTKPIDEYRKAIRGEIARAPFDTRSICSYFDEFTLFDDLDAHLGCITYTPEHEPREAKASDLYKFDFDEWGNVVRVREDLSALTIYTRRAFENPIITVVAKMPMPTGVSVEFGLGDPVLQYLGGLLFDYGLFDRNLLFFAHTLGAGAGHFLDWAKPTDAEENYHAYTIRHGANISEAMIDGKICAFFVNAPLINLTLNGPPYLIVFLENPIPTKLNALLRVFSYGEKVDWYVSFGVTDGPPVTPKAYSLYQANSASAFAGLTVSSGTLVSHPIPVFGFRNKTIYFMADKDSTSSGFVIEVFTRSLEWRTYDAMTYPANKLLAYPMAGDAILARVSYTPASYPATVLEGEVVLA